MDATTRTIQRWRWSIAELKAQIKALETQGESKTMEDAKR